MASLCKISRQFLCTTLFWIVLTCIYYWDCFFFCLFFFLSSNSLNAINSVGWWGLHVFKSYRTLIFLTTTIMLGHLQLIGCSFWPKETYICCWYDIIFYVITFYWIKAGVGTALFFSLILMVDTVIQ